jgi:hypothetical protein
MFVAYLGPYVSDALAQVPGLLVRRRDRCHSGGAVVGAFFNASLPRIG